VLFGLQWRKVYILYKPIYPWEAIGLTKGGAWTVVWMNRRTGRNGSRVFGGKDAKKKACRYVKELKAKGCWAHVYYSALGRAY